MTSNDISPEAIREATSSLNGSGVSKFTFEVPELSNEDISRVLDPFNEMVKEITGKDMFDLINDNRK